MSIFSLFFLFFWRGNLPGRRRHDAPLLGTATVASIVFHAKVMAHFMSNSRGNQTDNVAMVHVDTAGKLVRAHRPFQRFADNSAIELDTPAIQTKKILFFFFSLYLPTQIHLKKIETIKF